MSLASAEPAVLVCAPIGRTAAVVQRFLAADGFEVETCADLDALVTRLGTCGLAIVTAELLARETDVHRLGGALDAHRMLADPSVIVLASNASAFRELLGRQGTPPSPAIHVVERPLSPATLRAMVGELLTRRRERMRERLRIAELEARNSELDAFGRTLAHDLRAPLQTVTMALDVIDRVCGEALGEHRWMLERARHATTLIDQTCHELLMLAVADHAELGAPEPIDTAELLRDLADDLAGVSEPGDDREPRVVIGDVPRVVGHPVLLRQLFQNLVANGLKYNMSPEPTVRIDGAPDDEAGWTFRITDNGIGLPDDRIDALFEPFARGHVLDKAGTGLGLAICRRVVELHHGTIEARNLPDGGAEFIVRLPRPQTD